MAGLALPDGVRTRRPLPEAVLVVTCPHPATSRGEVGVVPMPTRPLLSMRRRSVPPVLTAAVSAAGKKIPVLVSPVVVILGAAALPAANSTVEALVVVTMVPVAAGIVTVKSLAVLGVVRVTLPPPVDESFMGILNHRPC